MLEEHKHEHPTHNFDGIVENRERTPPIYFNILFYGLIAWGLVFSAYFLLSGWSSEGEFKQEMADFQQQTQSTPPRAQGAARSADQPGAALDAEALYLEHCAVCHGDKGEGGIGPDLRAGGFEYGRSREKIAESISQGRPGGMPGFASQLSADKIQALAAYVLELK